MLAEPVEGVSATPYEDNMRYGIVNILMIPIDLIILVHCVRYFNVAIAGPLGTPYEGLYIVIYFNLVSKNDKY